jgi:FSR family fosmidomycin resistance protein-like MFS transporter
MRRRPVRTVLDSARLRRLGTIGLAHGSVDLCHGAVPAVLPFLVAQRGLGYAAVGGLLAITSGIAALGQPAVGAYVDRKGAGRIVPIALLVAGAGLAGSGLAGDYLLTAVALAAVGVGVALFHPPAYTELRAVAAQRAAPVGAFAVAGNVGFAVGPIVVAAVFAHLGLEASPLLIVPALLATALLVVQRRAGRGPIPAVPTRRAPQYRRSFAVLTATTLCRSVVFVGVETFAALYAVHRFGLSAGTGDVLLTLFLAVGVAGNAAGGLIADAWSRPVALRIGYVVSAAGLVGMIFAGAPEGLVVGLVAVGFGIYLPFSADLTLAQDYLPARIGVASGVALGLSVGAGGLAAPALGALADAEGLRAVFALVAAVSVVSLALTAALPEPRRHQPRSFSPTE